MTYRRLAFTYNSYFSTQITLNNQGPTDWRLRLPRNEAYAEHTAKLAADLIALGGTQGSVRGLSHIDFPADVDAEAVLAACMESFPVWHGGDVQAPGPADWDTVQVKPLPGRPAIPTIDKEI